MKDFFKRYQRKLYRLLVLPFANRRYIRQPALFESIGPADPAKLFVVTVAFNDPDLIVLHRAALQKYLRDPHEYFVFDNSSNEGKAEELKAWCLDHKVNYVRLPFNRYRTNIPSASHSFALNWNTAISSCGSSRPSSACGTAIFTPRILLRSARILLSAIRGASSGSRGRSFIPGSPDFTCGSAWRSSGFRSSCGGRRTLCRGSGLM